MKNVINQFLMILILSGFAYKEIYSQKQIAITIDDPNTNNTFLLNWQERNNCIIKTLDKYNIKAATIGIYN